MTFKIGDVVKTPRYVGVVHDTRNGAAAPEFEVRKLGGPEETTSDFFKAEELSPASLPARDASAPVLLNAGIGRIVEQNGDYHTVEIVRPRRCGMAYRHRYKVPRWCLLLGTSSGADNA